MKKFLVPFLAIGTALILTACSKNDELATTKKEVSTFIEDTKINLEDETYLDSSDNYYHFNYGINSIAAIVGDDEQAGEMTTLAAPKKTIEKLEGYYEKTSNEENKDAILKNIEEFDSHKIFHETIAMGDIYYLKKQLDLTNDYSNLNFFLSRVESLYNIEDIDKYANRHINLADAYQRNYIEALEEKMEDSLYDLDESYKSKVREILDYLKQTLDADRAIFKEFTIYATSSSGDITELLETGRDAFKNAMAQLSVLEEELQISEAVQDKKHPY